MAWSLCSSIIVVVQSNFSDRSRFCDPLCDVTSREHCDQRASACAIFFCFVRVCFRSKLTVVNCMQWQAVE